MSPPDRAVVRRKLAVIVRNLRELEDLARTPLAAYLADLRTRKLTERFLQEAIEAAIDINRHLVRVSGGRPVDDNHASFLRMADVGVLPRDLATGLVRAAGLRNHLVHEYDTLDDTLVLESAGMAVERLPLYVAAVEDYLSRGETHP